MLPPGKQFKSTDVLADVVLINKQNEARFKGIMAIQKYFPNCRRNFFQ
jgi:hypothetical protein